METITETITNEILVNSEPEFVVDSGEELDANIIILCEEITFGGDKFVYEYEILGKSILSWVERVAGSNPTKLRIAEGEDFLRIIKPFLGEKEYTIVLYANTPLLSKSHLEDIFSYAKKRRLAVCKLKKGYILNTSYIKGVEDVFSVDSYNVASDDFYEIDSPESLTMASEILNRRLIAHHLSVGTEISSSVSLDANVKIGKNSQVLAGSVLSFGSEIGGETKIGENVVVKNSKLGEGVTIGAGVILQDSIIKDNVKIEAGTVIKHSVVGENCFISSSVAISESAIKENCFIDTCSCLEKVCVMPGSKVGKLCALAGLDRPLLVEQGSNIAAGTKIVQ